VDVRLLRCNCEAEPVYFAPSSTLQDRLPALEGDSVKLQIKRTG